ncbi:nucleotidyl transferase AbiEii/AbiGii toxin family protein [Anabaena azotica]|uniref:Nucleotidyl transferase AbiEii/AbiGii toxin family protein n=1 Tax=Anabaena azotica FACHB-119 TaxID=947527 RepID=A0ABR8DEH3_9NOST|nr:nucleotidyl transferase AbiEii/AbiGii toxin family protein [Anabaena azotica]MBD2505509.1 nucleotidyl transferase AbiEii/AbiGii toxin family protein [Anabaena azotica FACHB-119]
MNESVQMLEKAANLLADVHKQIVFVGGATISLYLDELSSGDVRSTNDVDCVVEITSTAEYYHFSEKLRKIGLEEDIESRVICRWRYQNLIMDIMPTNSSALGFSNSWYEPGVKNSIIYKLPSGQEINIFPVPYLLASKIEAFLGRGNGNYYYSHDLEDIILLLDGCPSLEEEIQQASEDVKKFIKDWFTREQDDLLEIAPSHLSSTSKNAGRDRRLLSLIERLAT